MSILIFLHESELSPAGGPLGVGYYIHEEVKKRGLSDQIFFLAGGTISFRRNFFTQIVDKLPAQLKKHIRSIRRLQKMYGECYPQLLSLGTFKILTQFISIRL